MNRSICILTAGALAWSSVNPAAGAADGTAAFSIPRAAEFLDANAHAFEKNCFACHATFAYLMARPAIPLPSSTLQETRRALEQFNENQANPGEISPRRVAETVMTAAALAMYDASTTGKLQPQTRQALERIWDLQRDDGGWDWLKADEPPSAVDEHFGATMAVLAAGVAPEDYANSARARQGIEKACRYLREHPPTTMHQRVMLLLASARLGGLLDDAQREQTASALFALQGKDGGWAMASLADWKRLDGTPQQLTEGDGYGTGLVLYALQRGSRIPGTDPRLQKAVNWLKTHQRENGSWYTRSPRGRDDLSTYSGTVFAVLGLSASGELDLGSKFQPRTNASILRLDASRIFETSVTHHLRLSEEGKELELEAGELFEDDGPAAGHSYQKPDNREMVTPDIWIKKELLIPNPQASAALLVVLSEEPFEALINGVPQKFGENQSGRKLYKSYAFDPTTLKAGRNEIVLRKSGKVLLARDDEFALGSRTRTRHPNRSAKSTDAGKTWNYDHLGPDGKLDGEYGIRIFLEHYRPHGSLTMPVVDAGNLEGSAVGAPISQIGPIQVTVEGAPGPSGQILVRARSGGTYVPTAESWSEWQVLGETGGTVPKPRGRYVQIGLDFSTRHPLQSPRVSRVLVEAAPVRFEDWTARLRVLEEHNEPIVRTSIPFEYEPLNHPHLKRLREQYKLDEVVQGAPTELELMLRLAQWACNYWDWPDHIMEYYPPWDALEILKPCPDGKAVGGFCQQFNLVFLQACESFGLPGRAISISQGRWQEKHPGGGHEVVELWSNEWKKWVYVDGALAWYIVDQKTGAPLSIWELRQRQLLASRGETFEAVRLVDAVRTKNKQFVWNGLGGPKPLNWYLELRLIPRSNFLQEKSPLPLNQGTEEWSWTGHYVWTDADVPAGNLFDHRLAKRSDFEWTLNQVHYVLEPGKTPGTLRVHMDTETPSFETFLVEMDAGEKKPMSSGFTWTLHSGQNRLRMRPRNIAGREGIPSWITLEYP